ncbi:glycosyltransferase family 87 protein [Mucilaginibacter gynuensis]|uniref:Glycosyltransferase family 87 protein n=1 Tax=Mucilaginibacter gynuensis TaxID=1302236 RepID=A0ABP8HMD4_9SPHI
MVGSINLFSKPNPRAKHFATTKDLLLKQYPVLILWIAIAVFITHGRLNAHAINNYLIFKNTFTHAINHINLYGEYKNLYYDSNYYGPLFSLIMAPFSLLGNVLQLYAWQVFNVCLLFFAIQQLPLSTTHKNIICLICTQELYTSLIEFQTNGAMAALIILSWALIQKRNDFWAAFCIVVGLYVKLYGIVGIAFFFFSGQKLKFMASMAFWAVVLFVLPMAFFSPQFILHSYADWYNALVSKNGMNQTSPYQDVSLAGMVRRIVNDKTLPSLPFIAGGMLLMALPYVRISRYKDQSFRLLSLSSILLFTVLFSSGSELVTYIIAFAGIGIWFMSLEKPAKRFELALLIFAIYFGSLFATDLFPKLWREQLIKPYALKALPCLVVWLMVIYQMLFKRTVSMPSQKPVSISLPSTELKDLVTA